ncbi:ATP-binding protein [Paenibacillus arenosi]|uniref:histidine kinase n=1 Tax=Paenibacillus arenosi TaxID=2774142 RepID=A0ABR9AZJ0_9BACL|nr:ATP-binding protein [Paenibacillus arenosi]MBD8499422.1 hypothetical protein [Paenibacillus arenosi]
MEIKTDRVDNQHTAHKAFFMSVVLVVCTFFAYITYIVFTVPIIGIFGDTNEFGSVIITEVSPLGKAYENGLQVGDRIIEVDGIPAAESDVFIKHGRIENADSILVDSHKSGIKLYTFDVEGINSIPENELIFGFIVPLFFFVANLIISIILYVKCRHDKAAIILVLYFLMIGFSYYASSLAIRIDPIGRFVMSGLLPVIPFIFLYFMNVYLRRYDIKFIYRSKYTFIALLLIELVVIINFILAVTDVFSSRTFDSSSFLTYITLIIGYGLCLYCLIDVYRKARHDKLKPLFKIMLVSHAIAFTPFVVLNLIPLILFKTQLVVYHFTTLFLIALPVGYLYLFTSKKLFDVDFVVTRFKYYASLALIPSLIVTTLLVISLQTASYFWVGFKFFIIVYSSMMLLLYLKEQIDYRYRPKIFKQMYSLQEGLDRYSSALSKVMKRDDLERSLSQEIRTLMPVEDIYFFTIDKGAGSIEHSEDMQLCEEDHKLLLGRRSLKVADIVTLEDGLCLIIGRRNDQLYAIWIGNKVNNTTFNVDELRWFKTVANYTSILNENLYLIQNLLNDLETEMQKGRGASPWVLRLIFCLSENERRRLASDLHDSALQDQLIWFRKLETFLTDYKYELSSESMQQLYDIKEGLLDVIFQIRETCNELRPPLLKELGLQQALDSLLDHMRLHVNYDVQFHVEPLQSMLSEEQITAVYRIVQELLRNTSKHAQANKVWIELRQKNDQVYFTYQDDGIGMDLHQMESSFSHMGMSGIRERVISLEGEIEFHSEKGHGFEVQIMLPTILSSSKGENEHERDSYLIS